LMLTSAPDSLRISMLIGGPLGDESEAGSFLG
jgi:hypothetical protein